MNQQSKKINKYLDLVKEPKKQGNMKVAVLLIVVGALGTVPKGLKKKRLEEFEIRGRVEIIQAETLLKSYRILKGPDLRKLAATFNERLPIKAGVKKPS